MRITRTRLICFSAPQIIMKVLGRWAHQGINFSKQMVPTCTEPVSIADMIQEYMPQIEQLCVREPRLAAMFLPTAKALASGKRAHRPTDADSLLRGPMLRCSQRCALPSCHRATAIGAGADGEERPLKLCTGGCNGLARYCSVDHQREHWPKHKELCKREKSVGKTRTSRRAR